MPVSPKLHLKLQHRLQLAPHIRHALRMMQMTKVELIDHVKEIAESNPLLEIDFATPFDIKAPDPSNHSQSTADHPEFSQWISPRTDLREHLRWQINLLGLSPKSHQLAMALIDHIDDQGLLTASINEATELLSHTEPQLRPTQTDVEEALGHIQKLDPVGVGATSLKESLIIQLQARYADHAWYRLAHSLLEHAFEELAKTDIHALAQQQGVKASDIRQAFKLIQTLNPHPASSFDSLDGQHIIPDIYVFPTTQEPKQWQVVVNQTYLPAVAINTTYSDLIGRASESDRRYLDEKLKEAKRLIDAIGLRQQTLARLTHALVAHQSEYLSKGNGYLRPLTQAEMADQLGLHVSTISRAARGKFAQTPQGLIELKRFFCQSLVRAQGQAISSVAVKVQIKTLIDSENQDTPLSDQAIAARLADNGVKIARRTVTKYREQLGIADSRVRREQRHWF